MNFPLFYHETLQATDEVVVLDEASSKHVTQVLRMQAGETLQLTNGRGLLCQASIADDNRKRCQVQVKARRQIAAQMPEVTIAISPVKNNSRFEWFLEKATEMGVRQIVPLLCGRTEKQHLKMERMRGILVSAMLQSEQAWLPQLMEPIKFNAFVQAAQYTGSRFIAHCEADIAKQQLHAMLLPQAKRLILIGPEGDFTPSEIALALQENFVPVALGNTRLRTETAGIFAAAMLCNF